MRPFQFQDDYVDMQEIQRVAQDVPPSLGHYCKVKFSHSLSLTPTYKLFLKNKISVDKSEINDVLYRVESLSIPEKIVGDFAGLSGLLVDPIILFILILVCWGILKSKIANPMVPKIKNIFLNKN